MNKEENTESMKETFNVSFQNIEMPKPKSRPKLKLIISIIATTLILSIAIVLLIGYFKFDWFKNEIYKIDANVTREVNQANYFTETKKINTKIALTKDEYNEQNYEVNTDFMVYIKDKTELKQNDNLYTATLIILKSKMTSKDEVYDLPSFDIKDENQIKDFESKPDGAKYPIAFFSFFDNGTISKINYPKSTDEYNTQTLKELIEKVIPKLTRNRTEDNNNGLKIKTRTDRKKKTLIEEEKPKQYYSFKGSKFSKSTERDFEDDKLTDIRTTSDIYLKSSPDQDEQTLGATDFYFKSQSTIKTYEFDGLTKIEVIHIPLDDIIKKLIKYGDAENEETPIKKPRKGAPLNEISNRRLGAYSISAEQTFNIGKYDVLGQTVTVKYHVAVKNGNPINEIIIDSKLGKTTIGNTGVTLKGSWSKTVNVFTFVFPAFPLVSLNAHVYGSVSWGVSVTSGSGSSVKLSASLSGTLSLGCEVKAGWDPVASFSGGVEGVIVSASGYAAIENKKVTKNFSISAGRIYVYLDRSIAGNKKRVEEKTLFNGW